MGTFKTQNNQNNSFLSQNLSLNLREAYITYKKLGLLNNLSLDVETEKQLLSDAQSAFTNTKKSAEKTIIKNYLFLILFKINKYYYYYFYNSFNTKKLYNYLKDLLVFNSRHTNYVLYMALKEKIKELFDIVNDKEAIEIIKDIIFQKDILYKYLIDDYFKNDKDKNGEDKYQIDIDLIFSRDPDLLPKKNK